jgi:drug/metabolite transporter (DMT)-like permease
MSVRLKAVIYAILAAIFYGFSIPFSKPLLSELSPLLLASLLYLGAGIGIFLVNQARHPITTLAVSTNDRKAMVGMVLLDVLAPILLLWGLKSSPATSASLLNNFEIVATTLIAMTLFRERVTSNVLWAIAIITLSSLILSVEDWSTLHFSLGSLLILGATITWGLENNLTRQLAHRDPLHIVIIKGLGSGVSALVLAAVWDWGTPTLIPVILALLLGFVAYGLSIAFYIRAQRDLGASKTSAYYAVAPFVGMALGWILYNDPLKLSFWIALGLMILGTGLLIRHELHH